MLILTGLLVSTAVAEEKVKVTRARGPRGIVLSADNTLPCPVTLTLDLAVRVSATTSVPVPATIVVPAGERREILTLRPARAGAVWRYEYVYHWRWGSNEATHAKDVVYELPYAWGKPRRVLQGFNGAFSHANRHAIDWQMPVGTAVHAARGGVVVEVVNHFEEGAPDPSLKERVNKVRIQHADGTLGLYLHFRRGGVAVKVGQAIRTGDLLGASGNTGYTTQPHLHFEVTVPIDGYVFRTVWTRFNTSEGRVFLKADRAYVRPGR